MKLETFFEKFDQFADAPDAVAKMRELVLNLAVQGKLLEQNPSDESATELLERLGRELTPEQRRRKAAPLSPLSAETSHYELPDGWAWAHFREVAIIASNLVKPDEFLDFTHLAPDNIEKGKGVLLPCRTVREDKVISSNHRFYPGQIVYSKIRPNLAKVVVVDFEGLCSADMYPIDALIDAFYLQIYMLSESFLVQAVKTDTRVAMPKINQTELNAIAVPVPPLAEQRRIVAKVDELMALCDRLEAQQQERETRHAALARASLARFADAPTPANLHFLFHPSYAISPADLRKSILNLAVYGKLAAPVPDDDEIPSIEKFREAAASLATSLGLRSPKESLDEADPPFDVPAHWLWMALADLGAAQTGTTPSKNDHEAFNGDIPFIKPADILPDGIDYSNESLTRYGAKSGSRLAPAGSLLMVCIGTIGKCNLLKRECAFNQQINSLSPVQWVDSQYLFLALRAPYFQDEAWKKSSSTTIAILNKRKWLSIPVPIPPLAEQRRIVAKVEQLMALVDALELQLATSRATAEKLLAAVVAELTEGTHVSPAC
jgi:type I restriction enzyme, S subunit